MQTRSLLSWRRCRLPLICGLLLGSAAVRAVLAGETPTRQGLARPPALDFLPISVWYSGGKARAPMLSTITPESEAEWRKDLEQIKALGFNTVRTWVEWAHCEPREGEFRFDNLRLLCRLADETALRVIVQVYADSAPDWVGVLHPDAQFEAQSGAKVPSQAAPGYCTDKPEVGNLVRRFYTEAARVANEYPNLYAWDLWSEPHIINWAVIDYVPNAQFCFCPHTVERFRHWLEQKYGSLDRLNEAWYRNFESARQVEPPRFGTILSYTDFIDWKTFIYHKLAADLRMRYEAIRAGGDRSRGPQPQNNAAGVPVITSHAAVPSIFTSPFSGVGASDDFLMAEQVDFYGTSLYPKHSFPQRHWPLWQVNVAMEFSRSASIANGGFYVGELQAGFGTRGLVVGNPVTHEDHRLWMWGTLARGARAINLYAYYPMSSGYEAGGYGLIELDGRITKRAEETGRLARLIDQHSGLLLSMSPQRAEVAILYNPLAQMIGGEQHSGPPQGHRDSLFGWYRAFSEHDIPVDFIHRRSLEKLGQSRDREGAVTGQQFEHAHDPPDQYKLLILPYPVMFTEAAARGVRDFVARGGHVVAEARLAWNDDRGYAADVIPGMGLSEVFGVRESSVHMADQVPMRVEAARHLVLEGLEPGEPLTGAYFAEGFDLLPESRTQVIARHADGSPAIVANRHGGGHTLALGTFMGLAYHQNPTASGSRFLLNLITWAGVSPRITRSWDGRTEPPVEVHLSEPTAGQRPADHPRYVLFLLNHGTAPQTTTFDLKVESEGTYMLRALGEETTSHWQARHGAVQLEVELPPRDARVLSITRAEPRP